MVVTGAKVRATKQTGPADLRQASLPTAENAIYAGRTCRLLNLADSDDKLQEVVADIEAVIALAQIGKKR
jgi:hypothetical protein